MNCCKKHGVEICSESEVRTSYSNRASYSIEGNHSLSDSNVRLFLSYHYEYVECWRKVRSKHGHQLLELEFDKFLCWISCYGTHLCLFNVVQLFREFVSKWCFYHNRYPEIRKIERTFWFTNEAVVHTKAGPADTMMTSTYAINGRLEGRMWMKMLSEINSSSAVTKQASNIIQSGWKKLNCLKYVESYLKK